MLRRRLISFGLASVAIVAVGTTAWAALNSGSYRLVNNTFEGGASGGGVSSASTSYRLEGITFGSATTLLSSSSYQMCTGFGCSSPVYTVDMASLQK